MGRRALSRADRLLLGIVLVTAVLGALITWLVLPPEKVGEGERLPSTFFNVASGTKAAYEVLERLNYPVGRLRHRIEPETLESSGTLFLLRPDVTLDRGEVAALLAWVKAGHALVVAPGPPKGPFFTRTPRGRKPAHPSAVRDRDEGSLLDEWFQFVEVPRKAEQVLDRLPLVRSTFPARAAREPLMAGIGELATDGCERFNPESPLAGLLEKMKPHAFWKDEAGIVGLWATLGEGTIVALADTYPLSNRGLSDADNGLLMANLARQLSSRYGGQITFDEFHLGFPEQDYSAVAMAKLVLVGPWRWAVVQAIFVGLLALWGGAVRFGSPRDVTLRQRRRHREFAEAAGRLLNEAGATGVAAETLSRHYRERLCRLLELGPEAEDGRIAQAVRERSGQDVAALLQQARGATSAKVGRQKLLALTRQLHHLVETLDHGA
jgi:hypothetical protein